MIITQSPLDTTKEDFWKMVFNQNSNAIVMMNSVDELQVGSVMRIIKLKIFPVPVRLHSGYGKLIIVIISPFFPIFKNVVHRCNSASHQVSNYAQRS